MLRSSLGDPQGTLEGKDRVLARGYEAGFWALKAMSMIAYQSMKLSLQPAACLQTWPYLGSR